MSVNSMHGRRWTGRWRAIVLLALLTLAGCPGESERDKAGSGTQPPVANQTDPHWVFQHQPRARVAVVFIHGLFGDTIGTWTPDAAGEAGFLKLLNRAPGVGDKVDIFAFGFTSKMFGSGSLNVREAASSLEESLKANGVLDYDSIVFVAHSMGGLVALRYLVRHRDKLEHVPLVVLYASPMDGADIANIASHVASNPALAQMFDGDGNEFLAALNEDWAAIPMASRPKVRCAYETARTGPIMVVSRRSATRWCEGNLVAIGNANHINIVKPAHAADRSLEVLVNALNETVFGSSREPLVQAPDFTENAGGEWVYSFRAGSVLNRAALVNTGPRALSYRIGRTSDDKLLVTPRPTPRSIPVNGRDELELFLLDPGQAQSEYTFELEIVPLGSRVVRVQIDDTAALQRLHADMSEAAIAGAGAYAEANQERISAMTTAQQEQALADAARRSLGQWQGDLPETAQWLLTASVLAKTPYDSLSAAALRKVEDAAPAVAEAPAVQAIARDVAGRSNLRVFRRIELDPAPKPASTGTGGNSAGGDPEPAGAPTPGSGVDVTDTVARPDIQVDTARLRVAADQLQGVSSQRQASLLLQGDLQRRAGQIDAAHATYENAARISNTPSVQKRLNATHVTKP